MKAEELVSLLTAHLWCGDFDAGALKNCYFTKKALTLDIN